MIKNSLFDYLNIRIAISALRLIAPVSILYTPCGFLNLLGLPVLYNVPLTVYTTAEAAFYLFVYLPRQSRLQAPPVHPPPSLSRAQRQRIFEKCIEAGSNNSTSTHTRPYPTGWFLPADATPTREDAVDWILWALFSTSREEGLVDPDEEDVRQEMDGYIERIEVVLGHKLPSSSLLVGDQSELQLNQRSRPDEETGRQHEARMRRTVGKGNAIKSMRITLDPVQMLHRPLLWYSIVCLVDTYTTTFLLCLGFKHYAPRDREYRICFPPRPILSLVPRASQYAPPGVVVPYWFRPHRSTTKLPIVFLHGIGIGLYPYIPFIRKIFKPFSNVDGDVGVLLPELLPISMHMTPLSVPPRTEMLRSLDLILEDLKVRDNVLQPSPPVHPNDPDEHSPLLSSSSSSSCITGAGWDSVVLVAHSYGTFVAGWVIKMCVAADMIAHSPGTNVDDDLADTSQDNNTMNTNCDLAHKIAHVILVDPIPILLSDPTVAHNFLYREPGTVCPRKLGSVNLNMNWKADDNNIDTHLHPLPLHASKQGLTEKPSWYSSASAWQLWYFASRDADVARTLCRAFFWAEGGIWREDVTGFVRGNGTAECQTQTRGDPKSKHRLEPTSIPAIALSTQRRGRNMAVVLGGMDQIVPSEAIRRYLTREERWNPRWAASVSEVDGEERGQDEEENEVVRILNDSPSLRELDSVPRHAIRGSKVNSRQHDSNEYSDMGEGSAGTGSSEGVLEVLFNPKLDHAVIFDEEKHTEPLVEIVRRYCAS